MAANGISTLSTKQARQIAKLSLAQSNKMKDGKSQDVLDLSRLPTQYNGNTISDNVGGLVAGRPWTSVLALFANNEVGVWFDPSDAANLNWRRNLLTYSEQFDNAAWVKNEIAVTANTAVAPDGTSTADKIIGTTGSGGKFAYQSIVTGGSNTFSFYAKQAEYYLVRMIEVGSYAFYATFNLQTGAVTASGGTNFVSADAIFVGNGWYRCQIVTNKTTTNAYSVAGFPDTITPTNTPASYTGDGISGIYIWGAQVEQSATASAYQKISDVTTEVNALFPKATLFQDTAGTLPVTTAGQTVALMLDKSKGLVLGPELVTNGDFSTDTAWTKEASWTISSGTANKTAGVAGSLYQSAASMVQGKTYQITFTVSGISAGTLTPFCRGTTGTGISANGTYTQKLIAGADSVYAINFYAGATFAGSIDNISIKELPGYHATQPTAAQRPTYGVIPYGGVRNLLTYTEQFNNAAWGSANTAGVGIAPIVTPNVGIAPDGTVTADRIVFSLGGGTTTADISRRRQTTTIGSSISGTGTYSFWARTTDGVSSVNLLRENSDGFVNSQIVVTGVWQRFSITTATYSTGSSIGFGLRGGQIPAMPNTADILIWGAQLEKGSTATAYQKVVSKYEVTEAGKASLGVLYLDGVDDGMATPSIDFSGTDKVTLWAGLQKMSDATIGAFAETSANSGGTNGAFAITAPAGANSASYLLQSRGTSIAQSIYTNSVIAAPNTSILTGIGDISGDKSMLMVNNVVAATSAADQGTGNYGNYPLYLFRRGGTTLPYNGIFTGLIIRGAQTSATTITANNNWMNKKTGAY